MLGLKGVIIVEGSFEQAYYCEQDYVDQVDALVAPYAPNGPCHDIGGALVEEATKAAAVLDQPSIGEVVKAPSGSDGSSGPSIKALGPQQGVHPIEVSSDLSP